MIEVIKICLITGIMVVNSVLDVKNRKISLWLIGILGISGIGFRIWEGTFFTTDTLWGVCVGIIGIIISLLTRGAVGMGDSLTILALGFFLKFNEIVGMVMVSITVTGLLALIMLTVLKKNRKYELPFVPFLLAGFMVIRAIA